MKWIVAILLGVPMVPAIAAVVGAWWLSTLPETFDTSLERVFRTWGRIFEFAFIVWLFSLPAVVPVFFCVWLFGGSEDEPSDTSPE